MGIVSLASLLLVVAHVYRLDRVMKFTATVNRKMYRNAYPRDHDMSRIKNIMQIPKLCVSKHLLILSPS